MKVTIRRATAADAPLVATLSRRTFYETFAAQNTAADMEQFLAHQFTHEALMAEVGAAGNTFFLAYADSEPVGYARLHEAEQATDAIELARLYATTNSIGKGVGKALMQACLYFAQALGKKKIWLGVWKKNSRAIGFYTAWGFEKVGVHDFRLGNDLQCDWIMEKRL